MNKKNPGNGISRSRIPIAVRQKSTEKPSPVTSQASSSISATG